jgi:enoyl-CoA hydratase/carnithine racemase
MAYEQILSEQRGAVLLLTLNRPEKLNAWNPTLQSELRQAITAANEDPNIGAIVLTGAGRAYCAGADISAWQRDLKGEGVGANRPQLATTSNWVQFIRGSKPVIAAVNGHAVGVGATHILPADIRIASENAKFGFVFVKMGVVPELASSYYLVQLVGLGAAQELVLTARMIDADEALKLGLVSRVVPPERLLDEALELANHIAALPPTQLRMVKELFTQNSVETDLDTVMQREGEALRQAYASPEFKEAVMAFMEKRAPNFRAVQAV